MKGNKVFYFSDLQFYGGYLGYNQKMYIIMLYYIMKEKNEVKVKGI